jgi:hypothetical protein
MSPQNQKVFGKKVAAEKFWQKLAKVKNISSNIYNLMTSINKYKVILLQYCNVGFSLLRALISYFVPGLYRTRA